MLNYYCCFVYFSSHRTPSASYASVERRRVCGLPNGGRRNSAQSKVTEVSSSARDINMDPVVYGFLHGLNQTTINVIQATNH